ncbi:MAG: MarR family transcriptional regulator [Clostridia bacterium]|nr:MarR family transcriptional regulator [Clostridia bacterium]
MLDRSCSAFRDSVTFFSRLNRISRRCMDSVLNTKPKCHFGILHRLAVAIETDGRDGSIDVSELAKTLYGTPQAVSRGLRILEQDGLVERGTDPSDRRKSTVRLTQAGKQAHEACELAMFQYGAAVAERLGQERLRRMHADIEALLQAMEEEASLLEQEKQKLPQQEKQE